jgi:hypothetical protein
MRTATFVLATSLAAACASSPPLPTTPSILVLPGTGKSFDQFRSDDQECRGFALSEVGKAAAQSSDDSYSAAIRLQRHYDNAFAQCMFARGHRVPVSGTYSDRSRPERAAARTPPPPPPSGEPPAEAQPDYRAK